MGEIVSYVCVRADHQWGSADAGGVHPKDGAFGWCPDGSLDLHEAHEWRACDGVPVAAAAAFTAYLGTLESAVS